MARGDASGHFRFMTTLTSRLTFERLREVLDYDPLTGIFHWRVDNKRVRAGDVAGCSSHGYIAIGIDGCKHRAHRLAWFWMTGVMPDHDIDHHDLDRSNNVFSNLRPATAGQNAANSRLRATNTSGHKGVTWDKAANKWSAAIYVNNRRIHLGRFYGILDAHEAYLKASNDHFGEFARAS